MRHVLVKTVSPTISLLSGMVTSVTNIALFVQSGTLVGRTDSGVDGISGGGGKVDVAGASAVAPVIGITNV
jgi:hypothetical protein